MTLFDTAYAITSKNEGGYANNPNDKGGETYAGISRVNHPSWSGWTVIDAKKAFMGGHIPTNTKFSELSVSVKSFYKSQYWDSKNFGAINDQNIANVCYDIYVNSGSYLGWIAQKALNPSYNSPISKNIPFSIDQINGFKDQKQLFNNFQAARTEFYKRIATGSNAGFLSGWLKRVAEFNYVEYAKKNIGLIILGLIFIVLLVFIISLELTSPRGAYGEIASLV
jgi:lysozyme family protein